MRTDVNLGDKVQDVVTGFVGIVVGTNSWLNGCSRFGLQRVTKKNEVPVDIYWVDEQQVKVLAQGAFVNQMPQCISTHATAPTPGGPMNDPKPQQM